MPNNVNGIAKVLLFFVWFGYIMYQAFEVSAARAETRAVALRAEDAEAFRDSTHNLARENARIQRLLADTARAFAKRIVQTTQRADAIDAALGAENAATYAMRVGVDARDTTLTVVRNDTADTVIHIRQTPYTIDANITNTETRDSSSLRLHVALDTIPVLARIECGAPADAGVRAASIMVTTPPWASVRLGAVQQNPDVCNAPARTPSANPVRRIAWTPLALSFGRQLGGGTPGWTATIGTAITIGATR